MKSCPTRSQDDLKVVLGPIVEIPAHLLGNDPVGIGIEAPDPDVEVGHAVEDSDFGPFRRRHVLIELALGKVRDPGGLRPCVFVKHAIQLDRDIGAHSLKPVGTGMLGKRWEGGTERHQ